jgi:hypothetical protein
MVEHRLLRYRETVLSSDVADAIERLTDGELPLLPRALQRSDLVRTLIEMAHLNEDGTVDEITPIARRALGDQFNNRLTNTGVFQAGYKHYEKRKSNPVVPVTDFFFRIVFGNTSSNIEECLDAMSDHEIRHSLPKRPNIAKQEDGRTPILDTVGDEVIAGDVAGIVIFPPNMQAKLLRAWLKRRANVATGQLSGTVNAISHARPATVAVEELKERTEPVAGAMRRALPRPRSPRS